MARCGCSGSTCSCLVTAGAGVAVSGTGTEANPYVIDVTGSDIAGTVRVQDTATVDLTLGGAGSTADPYTLSADATLALTQLSDITAGDTPASGDVPVWNGTSWDFAPPPTTPPGAVSVGDGLTGDGSGGDPIEVALSGTWGVAPLDQYASSTGGQETYLDTNGQIRVRPFELTADSKAPTDLATTYPTGLSTMAINSGTMADWPPGVSALLTTVRTTSRTLQTLTPVTAGPNQGKVWTRAAPNNGSWGPWRPPSPLHTSNTNVPVSNAASAVVIVTLPTGLVADTDYVVMVNISQADGASSQFHARAYQFTAATFSLFVFRGSGVAVTVNLQVNWTLVPRTD